MSLGRGQGFRRAADGKDLLAMQPLDPQLTALFALTTGVGYLMMLSGVGKSMLVWKRRNPCPSCGRQRCGCND
jgi:hypothetical protein